MGEDSGFQVSDAAAEAYERHNGVFMAPLVEALLDRAAPAAGGRVLDLACGTGFLARMAATRVGPGGHVTGSDLNAGMLQVARRQAAGIDPAITWQQASAMDLPFGDGAFDTVVCQQGIQFFPDLDVAVTEMARVTTSGGTVAATAWSPMAGSPYFRGQYLALTDALGAEATAGFQAAFRLTDADLHTVWERAGLRDVTVELHAATVTLPPVATYAPDQLSSTPWGPAFAASDPETQRHIVAQVVDALAGHTVDGVTTVPFSTWLVAGTK